jgi:hypothetical protein
MHDLQRAKRQVQLLEATITELRAKFPNIDPARERQIAALLTLAARVEQLEDMLGEALPTAGEGI